MKRCQSCESEEASLLKLKWHLANSSYHYTKEEDIDDVLLSAMVTQDFVPRKELEYLMEQEEEARQKTELASHPKRHKGPQQPKVPSDGDSNPLAVIGRAAVPAMVIGKIGKKHSTLIPLDTSELFSMQTQ